MTPTPDDHSAPDPKDRDRLEANQAWGAFSTVISGVAVWGGVGWLLSRWLGWVWTLPVGLILGGGLGVYAVWLRYGRA